MYEIDELKIINERGNLEEFNLCSDHNYYLHYLIFQKGFLLSSFYMNKASFDDLLRIGKDKGIIQGIPTQSEISHRNILCALCKNKDLYDEYRKFGDWYENYEPNSDKGIVSIGLHFMFVEELVKEFRSN